MECLTIEEYLEMLAALEEEKKKAIEEAVNSKTLTGEEFCNLLLRYTDNNNRWQMFAEIAEKGKLSDEAFNKGLADAWISGNGTGDYRALIFFFECKKELVMNEEELKYYNNLPDRVTLYRGCSTGENKRDSTFGISWTTSREVAEFFAFRYTQKGRAVYSVEVDKKYIKAIFLEREEFEVICFGFPDKVKLVTKKPTKME